MHLLFIHQIYQQYETPGSLQQFTHKQKIKKGKKLTLKIYVREAIKAIETYQRNSIITHPAPDSWQARFLSTQLYTH